VTVLERNPVGVTYGWGVTFRDDLLDDLFRCDPVSAQDIWNSAAKWHEYEVRAAGKPTTFLGAVTASVWAVVGCCRSSPRAPPTWAWTCGPSTLGT
jgi:hypothetical protein